MFHFLIKTIYASFPFKQFFHHIFSTTIKQQQQLYIKSGRKIASFKTHKCYFSFYLHNPFPSSCCCFLLFTANFFSLITTGIILCLAPLFTLGENHTIYYQARFFSSGDKLFTIWYNFSYCRFAELPHHTLMMIIASSFSLSFICFCSLNPISSIISCHSLVILKLLRQWRSFS